LLIKLLRFYQQYKLEDFYLIDTHTLSVLVMGMEQVTAEEQILRMDAASYPNYAPKDRRSSHKSWTKKAYPENFEARAVKTTDLELF